MNGLNAWCKVTVLSVNSCGLEEGGGRLLAQTLRLNTTLASLSNRLGRRSELGEGGGRLLAEALSLNTTVTSLNLGNNNLGEGG